MTKKLRPLHSGLTIIEVMTSIVVALIGVMGVMILVPFAVQQAQSGLDTEAAAVVARNAFNLLEIKGHRNPNTWLLNDVTPVSAPIVCSIDPLAVTSQVPANDYANTFFPYNLISSNPLDPYPLNYRIPVVNLTMPSARVLPMRKADARKMFAAADDLNFAEAQDSPGQTDAQLNGPSQVYDYSGATPVRRQSAGRFSWSAIAQPTQSPSGGRSNNWTLNVLVYKDREIDVQARDLDPLNVNYTISPHMRSVEIVSPIGFASPISTVQIDPLVSIPNGSIKKDDWVMLVNKLLDDSDWQIAFYRVVNFENTLGGRVTLDGPDFNFDQTIYQPTQMVHLKNVVAVFERTIVPEGNSVWNIVP